MATTAIRILGPGRYEVPSATHSERSYRVTSAGGTYACQCPDHQRRQRACKHIKAVQGQEAWLIARAKARQVPDHEMEALMERHEREPAVWAALWAEQQERGKVRSSWRAEGRVIGRSVKLSGPRTDDEMREALR